MDHTYGRCAKKWRVQDCPRGAVVHLIGPNVDSPLWDGPAFGATTIRFGEQPPPLVGARPHHHAGSESNAGKSAAGTTGWRVALQPRKTSSGTFATVAPGSITDCRRGTQRASSPSVWRYVGARRGRSVAPGNASQTVFGASEVRAVENLATQAGQGHRIGQPQLLVHPRPRSRTSEDTSVDIDHQQPKRHM